MAPYISSRLSDRVWLVPNHHGTRLDILKNLEANTRMQQSATARRPANPRCLTVADRAQPLLRPAPVNGSVSVLTQADPTGQPRWQSGGFGHSNRLIARTSDLSAWTVV